MASKIEVDTIVNAGGDNDSGVDLSTNDKVAVQIAGTEVVTVDTTGVVLNENSADRDFRVESDGNTHMLFVNGGNDRVGVGDSPNYPFHVSTDFSGFAVGVFNDGNHTDRQGIIVQCGKDNQSGTNVPISFYDGDGNEVGNITWTSGTVSYNAFSASHYCIIPNADNNSSSQDNAYPYGTLLEIVSIAYTQKDGSNTERGILYNVQKTQSANSKKVLGVYCSSMNGGSQNHTNMHQVYVLGDGHILCNNAGGNISVGDGICSSSTAGIGQKATANPSMIIGTAQQDVTFSGSETKLVAVQYGLQQFIPWS